MQIKGKIEDNVKGRRRAEGSSPCTKRIYYVAFRSRLAVALAPGRGGQASGSSMPAQLVWAAWSSLSYGILDIYDIRYHIIKIPEDLELDDDLESDGIYGKYN